MKPVLLIGHDKDETFGVAPSCLRASGIEILEHRAGAGDQLPDPGEVAGVVVFGGEMNVDMSDRYPFLEEERRYVRDVVDRQIPFLGICLGAQMLARALDHPVYPAPVREIGFNVLRPTPEAAEDRLVAGFRDGDMVFHWHEDTFELPEEATVLATGEAVHLQGFRYGELAWGLQFHFEMDWDELELWLTSAGEKVVNEWGSTSERLRAEAGLYLDEQVKRANEAFGRFAQIVQSP